MTTPTQVVETSLTTKDDSLPQDYSDPKDQTTLLRVTPIFKPFTVQNFSSQFILTTLRRQVMRIKKKII